MKKLVGINELKNHPAEYQKQYERYCSMQWNHSIDEGFYEDCLNEDNKWLDVSGIYYSVSYSQGDHAFFTGRVYLEKFLDEFDTENEYFVLREALKMGDCDDYMVVSRSSYRYDGAAFDEIAWHGWDEGQFDSDDIVPGHYGECLSILAGMNYQEYYDLCVEQSSNLEAWVKTKCEQLFSKLYDDIRGELDYQMSEEAFVEWADSMDEQFEIEVDDELDGATSGIEDGRLAA